MAETIKVLVPEEAGQSEDRRAGQEDQRRLCRQARTSDLRAQGRGLFYV